MTSRLALWICSAAISAQSMAPAAVTAPPAGSICVLSVSDPAPAPKSLSNPAGDNPPPDYSLQIGDGSILRIPHSAGGRGPGVLITGVPLAGSRLVKIRHQGKSIESFPLRFEERDRGKLCLFLKELYLTWQLWPAHSYPPHCNCAGAKSAPWRPK